MSTDIDFSVPNWLINWYHLVGTISFFLNSGCIYIILFKSDQIDNFRYFLLIFQIFCTITDFHITFLMQPIPLYPVLGGYCNGFLAVYFDVWAHYLMAFLVASIVAQIGSLAYCFFKKHQTIGKIMNRRVVPQFLLDLAHLLLPFAPVTVFILFLQTGMKRDTQMAYVKNNYLKYYEEFSRISNFAVYEFNSWTYFLAFGIFSGGIGCGFIFIFTTFDMLNFLKNSRIRRKISSANFKRHIAALKSLIAQFATSSLCLIPPSLHLVAVRISMNYAQVIVQFLLAVFSLHSSVNAVVLVLTTPPYRNFVLRKQPKGI
ncbi:Protein CBR-SRI-40 [Caenorhabditis briggsae]|uniref:Protein CBR-SRI-40 n=1 Tax=Caenorhabditis briggsae TaxID=6238 RepID=A8XVQ4_CAEBR|nr:Protein CBR-SRI-40 [Caenorhabditis briggsae]CAP36723.2 Protein CBR-SRI-40 [Caenorhabditis briggsae]